MNEMILGMVCLLHKYFSVSGNPPYYTIHKIENQVQIAKNDIIRQTFSNKIHSPDSKQKEKRNDKTL